LPPPQQVHAIAHRVTRTGHPASARRPLTSPIRCGSRRFTVSSNA